MTPQSSFMVLAPVIEGRVEELRALLASMNQGPGVVDPDNELVPFGQLERLHVARFVVLEAPTAGDIAVYGLAPLPWQPSLAFLGDIDGEADGFLHDLAARAGLSPFHFARAFRTSTGVTPRAFVEERRIERASALLTRSDRAIAGIALDTGFGTQSRLTSVFKRRTGFTPAVFRRGRR
jgi:AraC-like DNA-binding protein